MKVQFERKPLLEKLLFLEAGVAQRAFVPSMMMVLISIKDGVMWGTAYNEFAVSMVVLARGVGEGEEQFVLPLSRTVASLKKCGDNVTVNLDAGSMIVTFSSGRARWKEQAMVGSGFVRIPHEKFPSESTKEIDLGPVLERVSWAVSDKVVTQGMKGVHFYTNGNTEVVGGTNHCISLTRVPTLFTGFEGRVTVNMAGLDQVARVAAMGRVDVGINDAYFTARHGDYFVACVTLAEAYPNYQAILLPEDPESADTITLSRADLEGAIGMVSPFCDPSTSAICIGVMEGELRLGSTLDMVGGASVAAIPCDFSAEGDLIMKVHYKRLRDTIASLSDSDEIMILVPKDRAEIGVVSRIIVKSANPLLSERIIQLGMYRTIKSDWEVIA